MRVLVINAGSASLKFGLFGPALPDNELLVGEFFAFTPRGCSLRCARSSRKSGGGALLVHAATTLDEALSALPTLLDQQGCPEFAAIGHRVVHGGSRFQHPTLVDAEVEQAIADCVPLAPLHNPLALAAIALCRQLWPQRPQVAVFDTAFHHTLPDHAYTYAVPRSWRERGLRRYGFHGTSHQYVARQASAALGKPLEALRLLSCHLGNGASICAIGHGQSLDTSMGLTPLEGLVMGTRSGDVDPGLFAWLGRELHLGSADIESSLGEQSGLLALAGTADFVELERRAQQGDAEAQLAIRVFAYRVCKYLGAYAAVLGGVDAVVFTGGIGENSALLRQRCCERLQFLGLLLDSDRNAGVALDGFEVCPIHASDSRVQVLVTRSNEQWMIAQEVQQLLRSPAAGPTAGVRIPIAVSARHVHLSEAAVEALFGPGHVLQVERRLSQPEGWAAVETVQVCGPKGCLDKVRVLGPTRSATQIEVARSDTFTLGVEAPLRASGQLQGTPSVTLVGPAGRLETDGLIIAARHIHMSPHDAGQLGLQDGQYVEVHVDSGERALTFDHTLVRIKDTYVTEMHIDTDEANAAGIPYRAAGELVIRTEIAPGRVAQRPRS